MASAKLSRPDFPLGTSEILYLAGAEHESGVVMGTISCMSPEQVRGEKVDARSDIFSLGVVLYEMIAGRRPFEAGTKSDVIGAARNGCRASASSAALRRNSGRVGKDRRQVSAKDREDRYQSAKELVS